VRFESLRLLDQGPFLAKRAFFCVFGNDAASLCGSGACPRLGQGGAVCLVLSHRGLALIGRSWVGDQL
jgi:hypothetical protein